MTTDPLTDFAGCVAQLYVERIGNVRDNKHEIVMIVENVKSELSSVGFDFQLRRIGSPHLISYEDYPNNAFDPFISVRDTGSRLEAYCSDPHTTTGDAREQVFSLLDELLQQSGFRQATPPSRVASGNPPPKFYVKEHDAALRQEADTAKNAE